MSAAYDMISPENIARYRTFDPGHMLDMVIERMNLRNDAALARMLMVPGSTVSRIRSRKIPVSAAVIIRLHESSNISVRGLRNLMGDRRAVWRLSDGVRRATP